MAKRFFATELWDEDWFLDIPTEYKLFWFYILSACDAGGFFKVNVKRFNSIHNLDIDLDKAFEFFNNGKKRLRKVNGSLWLIEDFFKFQYGQKFNQESRVHTGIEKIYKSHGVSIGSLKGIDRL